ncbi:MAG TPA: hypothetical protein VF516_33670 [Kofleriaceae bacterium]
MSNLVSSPGEGSSALAGAQCSPASPGSPPPLHVEPASPQDGILPLANVEAAPTQEADRANLDQPRRLNGRDHEMLDFLVQKAIETCMPRRPEPPSPPGARQRSINRKP